MKTFKIFIILTLYLLLSSCGDSKVYDVKIDDKSTFLSMKVYTYADQRSLESSFNYSSDGQIVEYKSFSDSVLVGHWIPSYKNIIIEEEFFNNGQVRSTGNKKNGTQHGAWHYFNRNGQKVSQRYFENGKKSWNWFIFNQDSFIVESYDYIKDTGLWIQFYKNGQIKSSASYIDENLNGIFKGYFKQSGRKASPKPKEIGTFVENKKSGPWKYFNKRGFLIREENYLDGIINGKWYTYFENGNPKIVGQYLEGKRIGLWKWYDVDQNVFLEKHYKLNL
ncbi:MAG: hypothetical protein CBD58_04745 [bacterium TMED198]|nr:MAG: hypothetical protein CBD58_04745 [bacterium TMED198]